MVLLVLMTYRNLHNWVNRTWGRARKCEACGAHKIPFKQKRYFEWSNKDGKYSKEQKDWWQLCQPCHRKYDRMMFPHIVWNKGLRTKKEIPCGWCKKVFYPPKQLSRFCSKHCGMKARYNLSSTSSPLAL